VFTTAFVKIFYNFSSYPSLFITYIYTVFQKSEAKIRIIITTAYLIRIKYPLSSFNYHLSDVNDVNDV